MTALVVLLLAASVLVGCGGHGVPDQDRMRRDVEAMKPVLPRLEALHVEVFRDQDWCRTLVYVRGKYSNNNVTTTCNLFEGPGDAFDEQADADFAEIQTILKAAERNFERASMDFDANGTLTWASFDFDDGSFGSGYHRYVYEPGGPPAPDPYGDFENTVIEPDWYFQWEDWM